MCRQRSILQLRVDQKNHFIRVCMLLPVIPNPLDLFYRLNEDKQCQHKLYFLLAWPTCREGEMFVRADNCLIPWPGVRRRQRFPQGGRGMMPQEQSVILAVFDDEQRYFDQITRGVIAADSQSRS
jgi:hypothetical protein